MKGSCLCQQIQFEIAHFQPSIANCHCSMCRKFSGAAFGTFGTVKLADIKWLRGYELIKVYPSSSKAERGFCSHCGSSIFYRLRVEDADYEIALGILDDEPDQAVTANIFCGSRAKWAQANQPLPDYDKSRSG